MATVFSSKQSLPQFLIISSHISSSFDFCPFSTLNVSNAHFRFCSFSVSIHPSVLPVDLPVYFCLLVLPSTFSCSSLSCFLALPGLCHRPLHISTVQLSSFCIGKFLFTPFCSLIPLQLVTTHG